MADIYLLTGLTLPQGVPHESLPGTVTRFMADCWPGMSRTQMMARAKRRGLRLSFRATAPCPSGENRRVRAALHRWRRRMPDAGAATAGWKQERWESAYPPDRCVPTTGARSPADQAVLTGRPRLPRNAPLAMLPPSTDQE